MRCIEIMVERLFGHLLDALDGCVEAKSWGR